MPNDGGDATRYFFNHVQSHAAPPGTVSHVLEAELSRVVEQHIRRDRDNHDCLLADMGDFIVSIMNITCQLSAILVAGGHVERYLSGRTLLAEPGLATNDYLDDKHHVLKSVPHMYINMN